MRGRFERFDMRTGGSYRLVLTYEDATGAPGKTSASADVSEVQIRRVDPGERVVHDVDFESDDPAFRGTMRMEWSVRSVAGGTMVDIVARDVPSGIGPVDHAKGITGSLVNLCRYLES